MTGVGSAAPRAKDGHGIGEAALIDRIRARDRRAFEMLYRAWDARLSRFLLNLLRRPHTLGADTSAILATLGYTDDDVAALRTRGAVR